MDLAKNWRLKGARYRLEGQRSIRSGEVRFPAQEDDTGEWQTVQLSGRGEVFSYSVLRQAPDSFDDQTPYAIALVRLTEGPLLTAQLTDVSEAELAIGLPVELVTRKLRALGPDGLIVYGYKFRPVLS
jgi:uncharacterized protein